MRWIKHLIEGFRVYVRLLHHAREFWPPPPLPPFLEPRNAEEVRLYSTDDLRRLYHEPQGGDNTLEHFHPDWNREAILG